MKERGTRQRNVLYKSVAPAAAGIVLLQLNKLELAEGLENVLEILFRDAEVNIAYIEAVEWDRVGMATC